MRVPFQPPKIKWCEKCGRYYAPDAPHGCINEATSTNRKKLESWLGKYTIREDK